MENVSQVVSHFIVCAGSRNIPLIQKLISSSNHKIVPHFDEREASFFALGLAKKIQKPVALVCTSGTALTECYSAVVEAYYQNIPLIIISADRPTRYRGTGAPQTIEQKDIFGKYVLQSLDLAESAFDIANLPVTKNSGPIHYNIFIEDASAQIVPGKEHSVTTTTAISVETFFTSSTNPLLLLGEVPLADQKYIEQFCHALGASVYAEPLSGLRESKIIEKQLIKGSERCVKKLLEKGIFDRVLRIGGVPTLRVWRDLEDLGIQTLSVDTKAFSGSPASQLLHGKLEEILKIDEGAFRFTPRSEVETLDKRAVKELTTLLYDYPQSEPALFYSLSHQIHSNDIVFLGNSLPIREWDLTASRKTPHPLINAQRGTNGIDGQLSNFFGSLDGHRHNWGVFGDLTTLYGLNAFSVLKEVPSVPVCIVIFNNGGGDIFRRLPALKKPFKEMPRLEDIIVNKHAVDFEGVAKLWGLKFERVTTFDKPLRTLGKTLVEVIPDPVQTEKFWNTWNIFWDSIS